MNRRALFGTIAAAALTLVVGGAAEPPQLRAVWRRSARGPLHEYERVRMCELRIGDVFRLEGHPTRLRVDSEPRRDTDGVWVVIATSVPEGEVV